MVTPTTRMGRAACTSAPGRPCGRWTHGTGLAPRGWRTATSSRSPGWSCAIVGTPGHTSDSLSLVLAADGAVLTGDTVLGRGTAVIAHPDGDLADYLRTLDRLSGLVDAGLATQWLLPGHGPALDEPADLLAGYKAHRLERLARVRAAWESGITDLDGLLDAAYPEVGPQVRWAARLSLMAQVEYLRSR